MALTLASCDNDQDLIYTSGPLAPELGSATTDIVLDRNHLDALVLSLYWNEDGKLSLSDPDASLPASSVTNTIQLSATPEFSQIVEDIVPLGSYGRQYTCSQLNSYLSRLGYEGGVKAPLYVRLKRSIAANVEGHYSEPLVINVTPYYIDMTVGYVIDPNWADTGMTLYSAESNGIYTGFMGVSGWYNWYLREGNDVVWGNLGVDGKSFYAASDDSRWNFWFPGDDGCYYTTVNTAEGWWSALHIDNLTISGDISGEMTYAKSSNQWSLAVNLPSAGTVTITLSGQGTLYDTATTANGPGVPQTIGFGGDASHLTFGSQASAVTVDLPAGETTLLVTLSNPMAWTVGAGEAAPEPEIDTHLYFSGLVTWDGFDDYLTLYDESSLSYGGAHWIDSEWGYRVYPATEWNPAYKGADDATPEAGSLVLAESEGNVPAPAKGLYVMDFSMKNLTYSLVAVTDVTFAGLNDNWAETPMTQSAENPEVFTAEFVKEKETPWGVKVLINHDWGLFFGGGNGTLMLGRSDATGGFDGDNDLETGKTYILTVDLGRQTYSYTLK